MRLGELFDPDLLLSTLLKLGSPRERSCDQNVARNGDHVWGSKFLDSVLRRWLIRFYLVREYVISPNVDHGGSF
jgi:hypothetical protein